jgi:hypothetical protein
MSDKISDKRIDKPLDPEFERRLESWLQSKAGTEVSPGTQKRIVGMLSSSLAPVKPLPSHGRLILTFLGIFAACVVAIVPMTGWMGIHLMTGGQIAWMIAILAGGATLFSFTLASRMVPGGTTWFPLASVLGLSGVALIGGMALLFPWHVIGRFASEGWPCAVIELVVAVPAAGLFWLVVRRGAPFREPGLGAAVSGLSVFLALTVVQTQCMFPQAPHLLVWHGGVAAVLIGFGALAGFAVRRFRMS